MPDTVTGNASFAMARADRALSTTYDPMGWDGPVDDSAILH